MKNKKSITILVLMISAAAVTASSFGIFSGGGPGQYIYESIRGEDVVIYGSGIYRHMSAVVALQGIAQDYVTLLIGVPLLLVSLFIYRKNSIKGLLLLSGTAAYFLVTYLFYLTMAMYNQMFLVYAFLLGTSFFAFILALFSFDLNKIKDQFGPEKLVKNAGIFLIVNSILIGLLWLSIVLPPLLEGSIIPREAEHYTTLIVQGIDLGLLLPASVVTGCLAVKKNIYGILFTAVYMIFLSLLMFALLAKIIFMADAGVNVIPAAFIISAVAFTAVVFSVLILRNAEEKK